MDIGDAAAGGGSALSGGDDDDAPAVPPALEAHGLADFVAHTLSLEAGREAAQAGGSSGGAAEASTSGGGGSGGGEAEAPVVGVLATPRPVPQQAGGFLSMEDPELGRTSPTTLLLQQQMQLVRMARQRVLAARTRGSQ